MKGTKKPVKFKSLSLPEPLFKEMRKFVKSSPEYRTMAEFLRVAIREKIDGKPDFLKEFEEKQEKMIKEKFSKFMDEVKEIYNKK